jgi:HEAT repeat protein
MTGRTVEELIHAIPELLGYPDDPAFAEVVGSLADIPGQELVRAFDVLLDDPDAPVALGIVRAIGMLKLRDAEHILLRFCDEPGKWFSHSDRAAIRMAAIESTGIVGGESAVDPLLDLLRAFHDTEIEMEIVRALGRIGSQLCVLPLIDLMRERPEIALSAAGALVEVGGEEAFQGLVTSLNAGDEMVRSASIWALGKLGDERAIPSLMNFSEASDAMTRRDMVWALGQIGGFRARLALGAISQLDPDIMVRREATNAILSGSVMGRYRG